MSKDAYIMLDRMMKKITDLYPEMTEAQKAEISNTLISAMEFGKIEIAGKLLETIKDNTTAGYEFD